jgi:hypothetical protein
MIKTRDLVRQLNLESYVALQRKFITENQTLLKEALILFRNELYTEAKMSSFLNLSAEVFFDVKQGLRREIYHFLKIDQEEKRCKLLFKINYLATRPSNHYSSEENFTLISCLQELIEYRMEYEAAPLFEKLAQLNRDTESYNEYYSLFRKHFNIKQSTQRGLSLLMHLNSKLAEFHEEKCMIYVNQIDKTFLEIKNIQTFNDNNLTNCITNISLLLISLFCEDSKYSFTRNQSLNATFLKANDQVEELPTSIERFYLRNILFFCAAQLKFRQLHNMESKEKVEDTLNEIPTSLHYNFNFPKLIAKKLLATVKVKKEEPKVIDIKQYRQTFKTRKALRHLNTTHFNYYQLSTKHLQASRFIV